MDTRWQAKTMQQSTDEEDDDTSQEVVLGSNLVDDDNDEEVYKLVLSDAYLDTFSIAPPIEPSDYPSIIRSVIHRNPLRDRCLPSYDTHFPDDPINVFFL